MIDPMPYVVRRTRLERAPLAWFRMRAADRPLVNEGDRVDVGSPLLERVRDPSLVEIALPASARPPPPGTPVAGGRGGRRPRAVDSEAGAVLDELEDELVRSAVASAVRAEAVGRVLYEGQKRRLRLAVGRHHETLESVVAGRVEAIEPGALGVRVDGLGLPGVFTAGDPAAGTLVLGVDRPDAELRAASINVSVSGAVLVGGARVDAEAVTRARAMGVRGLVTGGLVGKDLRTYLASDARQRAGYHATLPFGLVVVDGYGKRPIPRPLWACLVAAEGRDVALVMDPPMVVLPADLEPPALDPYAVWIRSGELVGREGRLVEVVGGHRHAAGVHAPSGRVALSVDGEREEERILPLADLERFE